MLFRTNPLVFFRDKIIMSQEDRQHWLLAKIEKYLFERLCKYINNSLTNYYYSIKLLAILDLSLNIETNRSIFNKYRNTWFGDVSSFAAIRRIEPKKISLKLQMQTSSLLLLVLNGTNQ